MSVVEVLHGCCVQAGSNGGVGLTRDYLTSGDYLAGGDGLYPAWDCRDLFPSVPYSVGGGWG